MNFGTLKTLARQNVMEAKKNTIGDTELEAILNFGALEIAARLVCLKTSSKFDSEADEGTYNITSKLTRYLTPDRPGLWYRSSASANYQQLTPVTIKWLDENKTDWRDASSGDPTHYAIEGDDLIVTPAPDSVISNAFWFYYGQAPVEMTDDAHYPFGGTTEIAQFKPLHMAIIKYWAWQAVEALNKGVDNYRSKENEFERELLKQSKMLERRADIAHYKDTRMSMGVIPSGF